MYVFESFIWRKNKVFLCVLEFFIGTRGGGVYFVCVCVIQKCYLDMFFGGSSRRFLNRTDRGVAFFPTKGEESDL